MSIAFPAVRPPSPAAGFRRVPLLSLILSAFAALLVTACDRGGGNGQISARDADYAVEVLAAAPAHGFPKDAFGADQLKDAEGAARDQRLRAALVAYARAQHGLGVPKSALRKDWGLRPAEYDAEADLAAALQKGELREWLDALPPANPQYKTLQAAYARYLQLAADGGWPAVPERLAPGASGPGVAALHQRLAAEDPELKDVQPSGTYDAALAAAVGRFQAAHGLPATGQIDKATHAELNVPALARAAQIRANLERLRWLPRDQPATRIDVNTAASVMTYIEDGQVKVAMRSASGKPGDETPILASAVDSIVINPPWNVPDGIAQEELYPKEAANPGYFAANNFVQKEGRLVQQPGPESALGLVKFDFDNPYAVYLHDTPAKAAFNQARRAVSHGCVRLEQAVPFARMLISREQGWSAERFDQVLASGETTTVKLAKKVPVRLMYLTAFPENGRIAFRPDVYGWDAELLRVMDAQMAKQIAAAPAGRRGG
ncbi:L,D-transpeptidase family protein [Phenylobacterium sp.]|jgi:murein L,D-transpeptidase YcbB/YkuD|uniref:L,D-transpeptidase family protein n=1 Tax=Phenylobacterium sp. TaxID=1871053 RepID=UPI002F9354A7